MTRTLWLIILAIAVLAGRAGADEPKHTSDTLEVIKENVKAERALIIDVREKREWDKGHLKVARLIPLSKLQDGQDPKDLAKEIDKQKILYLHCRSGRRSLEAAAILRELGYNVRPLKQGYQDLMIAGFEKAEEQKKERATKDTKDK